MTNLHFSIIFKEMLTQLRAIFDLIIQFQTTQAGMFAEFLDELNARQRVDKMAEARTKEVRSNIHL